MTSGSVFSFWVACWLLAWMRDVPASKANAAKPARNTDRVRDIEASPFNTERDKQRLWPAHTTKPSSRGAALLRRYPPYDLPATILAAAQANCTSVSGRIEKCLLGRDVER